MFFVCLSYFYWFLLRTIFIYFIKRHIKNSGVLAFANVKHGGPCSRTQFSREIRTGLCETVANWRLRTLWFYSKNVVCLSREGRVMRSRVKIASSFLPCASVPPSRHSYFQRVSGCCERRPRMPQGRCTSSSRGTLQGTLRQRPEVGRRVETIRRSFLMFLMGW